MPPSKLQNNYAKTKASEAISNEVANLRAAFKVFDTDKSGTLTPEEIVAVFTRPVKGAAAMTEADAKKLVAKFDGNNDGVLQIEEFIKAFTAGDKGADGIADNEDRSTLMKERMEDDDAVTNEKYNTVRGHPRTPSGGRSSHPRTRRCTDAPRGGPSPRSFTSSTRMKSTQCSKALTLTRARGST